MLFGQGLPRCIHINVKMTTHRTQDTKIIRMALIPAMNRPLVERLFRMGNDAFGGEILAFAQAITSRTRPSRVVKTKQAWLKLAHRTITNWARMLGG